MFDEIQRLESEIEQLKPICESLRNMPDAYNALCKIRDNKLEVLTRLKSEISSGTTVTTATAERDMFIADHQTNYLTQIIGDGHYKQQMDEIYILLETDFYLALKRFDILRRYFKVEGKEIEDFIERAQSVIQDMTHFRNFIRKIGYYLLKNSIKENNIIDILKKYKLNTLIEVVFNNEKLLDDRFVTNFFGDHKEYARDICIYFIQKYSIQIKDDKNINRNYVIFTDRRISMSNEMNFYTKSILSYLSQKEIHLLSIFIEKIEHSLGEEISYPRSYSDNESLLDALNKSSFMLSEDIRRKQHIAVMDDLLCLNSFRRDICNIQINQKHKTWSICIANDSLSFLKQGDLTRRDILEDIIRAIAEAWIDLLADEPMALFVLHPNVQNELGRLLYWHVQSLGSLFIELYERSNTSLMVLYEDFQHLFATSSIADQTLPSYQQLLSWLKLRPDNSRQTWLWVIQSPPQQQYIDLLMQLTPYLEKAQIWLRLVLPEQNAVTHNFHCLSESHESLEERFEYFFKLLTGDTFASLFRGEKSDAEAKQALIHIIHRARGSFKQAIRIFLKVYQSIPQPTSPRTQGRLKASDFAP